MFEPTFGTQGHLRNTGLRKVSVPPEPHKVLLSFVCNYNYLLRIYFTRKKSKQQGCLSALKSGFKKRMITFLFTFVFPAALAIPWDLLKMQNLRPHLRLTEVECHFQQGSKVILFCSETPGGIEMYQGSYVKLAPLRKGHLYIFRPFCRSR